MILKITINNIRNITPKQERINHSHRIHDTKSIQHYQRNDFRAVATKLIARLIKSRNKRYAGGGLHWRARIIDRDAFRGRF